MMKAFLLEKTGIEGQIIITDLVENYSGFLDISGGELSCLLSLEYPES